MTTMTLKEAILIVDNAEFPSMKVRNAWDVVLETLTPEESTEVPEKIVKKKPGRPKKNNL